MMNDLQHPDITAIERWGYPKPEKVACACSMCNKPIYVGDYALRVPGWGRICEDCVYDNMEEVADV